MAKCLGSKDRRLPNVSLDKLRTGTIHASPIQHGFRVVDTDLRNIGFPEPARVGSCTTRSIQEFEFIFVPSVDGNLTKGRTNLTHDIRCVKQGVLERSLELVPRILHQNALAFFVFKSLDRSLDRDTLQDDAQNHQYNDGRPHYLSSRQKGGCRRRTGTVPDSVDHLANLPQKTDNQEIQSG
jgi:hypothetical protein